MTIKIILQYYKFITNIPTVDYTSTTYFYIGNFFLYSNWLVKKGKKLD